MLRVALDTDVIVAARRSRTGASNRLLGELRMGRLVAVASVGMMVEYEAVLKRPDMLRAMRASMEDVDGFLDALAVLIVPVTPHFLWRPVLRDPADEMVLDAAVCGGAEAIVTFNGRDFLPGAGRFGVAVLSPAETLRRL